MRCQVLFISALTGLMFVTSSPAAAQVRSDLPIEIVPGIGHSRSISAVAFAPDGRTIVSGSIDKKLKLWDATNGRLLRTLVGHEGSTFAGIYAVAFAPDGKTILSGTNDSDQTLKLWDATSGRELRTLVGHSISGVYGVAFSPDGRTFVSSGPDKTLIWDAASAQISRTLAEARLEGVGSILFSPNGRTLLLASNKTLTIWEASSGRRLLAIATDAELGGIAFSPDGRTIVAGVADKTLKLWDAATGRLLRTLTGHAGAVRVVAFTPDGRSIVSGSTDKTIKVWDAASGRPIRTFALNDDVILGTLAPDGRTFITTTFADALIALHLGSGRILKFAFNGAVFDVALSPDGRTFVAGLIDKSLKLWDVATGRALRIFTGHSEEVFGAVFSPDGRSLASSSSDKTVKLWNAADASLLRTLVGHTGLIRRVAFSPDGRTVASGSQDLTIKLWDVATGRELRTITVGEYVNSVAFSPNGRTIVGTSFKEAKIWEVASGRELRSLAGHASTVNAVLFSPDGRTIASGDNDGSLKLWEATSGRELRTLAGHRGGIEAIVFSRDGRTIVSASDDNTIKVWDVASGRNLQTLRGHLGEVSGVSISPNGGTIVSGSYDSTVRIWNLGGEILATTIATPAGEWLTITPEGFFDASAKGAELLSAVQGLNAYSIDQFYQSLYRPDLVREKLAGDTRGLVRQAAAKLDLAKVLASGAAPTVSIVAPTVGQRVTGARATAVVEITNTGGGIGRIEWRVNGVTVGVEDRAAAGVPPAPAVGTSLRLTRGLALDAGDNTVEVVAYNQANLMASASARVAVIGPDASARTTARLFVLAVGLNAYADPNIRLNLAVPDAEALAQALVQGGKGLYASVDVTLLRDAEVRRERLDAAFTALAGKVLPGDTFVFFLAGHGKTIDGRYYFLPQNASLESVRAVTGAGGADARQRAEVELRKVVLDRGIAQEQWQAWFATIPAKKSVLLFDTCESGSLAEDGRETRALERDAANGRLAQATGRSILTAASDDQAASEGFRGHGLFTYNLLEALGRADSDRNGKIEVAELAAYVYAQVSALSEQVFHARQVPQIRISGNYALVNQAIVVGADQPGLPISAKPTHTLSAASELLIQPLLGAFSVRKLDAKTPVTLIKSDAGWTLIAREGRPLGFVATKDLVPVP